MSENVRRARRASVPVWVLVTAAFVIGALAGALTVSMIMGVVPAESRTAASVQDPSGSEERSTAVPSGGEATDGPDGAEPEQTAGVQFEPFDGSVETPIGSFDYPAELARSVMTEDDSTDGAYIESFYAFVGSEKVRLFTLSIGDHESGFRMGSAPDAAGKRYDVYVDIKPIEQGSDWTEEDVSRVNRLQEGVNDLMDQIRALEGFEQE